MTRIVTSEIAGRVWKLNCKVGDKIDADAPIMILESMKMEIPVPAPQAGTISKILVAEEDMIDEGQAVAEIEV